MALIVKDRIQDTSTTTGTGAVTVSGTAASGYKTFSAVMSTSDTTFLCIAHQTLDEWEVSVATYSGTNQLTRTTVLAGTNGTSAVNFSAGTKDVFTSLVADKVYFSGGTDVPVADGGTGLSSTTAYAVLCGGTTSTAALQSIASVGTSGHVLTSNGAGALPTFQAAAASGSTRGTESTATGGASIDFTGIPSTANVIILSFYAVSAASTGIPLVQIGDSGGIETSGYVSEGHRISSTLTLGVSSTAGLLLGDTTAFPGSASLTGHVIITRLNSGGTKWALTGIASTATSKSAWAACSKTLSAQLDRVSLTWTASDTFDVNGGVNIIYF